MPRKQTGELTPTQLKHRNAKERDAKFREFIQRQDVIEEASLLKKSKRIGHMKERFELETGYRMPLSMVYKNINRVYPKKVTGTEEEGAPTQPEDTPVLDDGVLRQSPDTAARWEEESVIEVPISDSAEGDNSSDGELQIV